MATERLGAAGANRPPRLGLGRAQAVLRKIGRAEAREHLGQADRWHAPPLLLVGTEQIERRGGAGQARAGQMEVAHGRAHMTVTEQALDGVDVMSTPASSRCVANECRSV